MKIRDLMHRGIEVMSPETPLAKLAQKMRDLDVGAIPVGTKEALEGIVTDRDIALRAVANGKDVSKLTAADVMTKGSHLLQRGREGERRPADDGGKAGAPHSSLQ